MRFRLSQLRIALRKLEIGGTVIIRGRLQHYWLDVAALLMETFGEFNIWKPLSTKASSYSLKFESNPFCFYIFQNYKNINNICDIFDKIALNVVENQGSSNLSKIFNDISAGSIT